MPFTWYDMFVFFVFFYHNCRFLNLKKILDIQASIYDHLKRESDRYFFLFLSVMHATSYWIWTIKIFSELRLYSWQLATFGPPPPLPTFPQNVEKWPLLIVLWKDKQLLSQVQSGCKLLFHRGSRHFRDHETKTEMTTMFLGAELLYNPLLWCMYVL